jgi:mannitol-1-phosphate 5-dehydrogenase
MAEDSPEEIVSKVCGIQKTDKIHPSLVAIVKRVQEDGRED